MDESSFQLTRTSDVVYFPGAAACFAGRLFTSLDILDRTGLNYVALGGIAHCCGVPYMMAGRELSVESAETGL